MADFQAGILAALPTQSKYLFFRAIPNVDPVPVLQELRKTVDGERVVLGIGEPLLSSLGKNLPGMKPYPEWVGVGVTAPSTPYDLMFWLRGGDQGDLFHLARSIGKTASSAFTLELSLDAFKHGSGRDLTGYEDGTENPKRKAANAAAFVHGAGAGLDGGSFLALQQWRHDFDAFASMSATEQDQSIGRHKKDNAEMANAPASSHVKRTEQESFDPAAFVLRRSMPWTGPQGGGLVFAAFGNSFAAFEAQFKRMLGLEDGIVDALFRFTKPVTGSYFWCPPMEGKRLDLRAIAD